MHEYVECVDCGFVTLGTGTGPEPKRWDECPDCGGTEFDWPE